MHNAVIFVDDEPHIRDAVSQALLIEGIEVTCFPNAVEALRVIDANSPAIIITDIHMPVMDGLEFMRTLLSKNHHFQFIVLTGHGDVKTAVEAMKSGAYDFLEKPFSTDQLMKSLNNASDKLNLLQENIWLKKELDMQTHVGPKMIGHSKVMVSIRRALISAPTNQPLIFVGQDGTGRRLAAQFAHDIHATPDSELIAASGEDLYELSLDALDKAIEHLTEDSNRCSLYLHSAEHISLAQWQCLFNHPKLERVFGATTKVAADVKTFATLIHLPTLDERKEDIGPLYKHFVRHAASRYQLQPPHISLDEVRRITELSWPENVKQLRQFAELRALKPETFRMEDWDSEKSIEIQSMTQRTEHFEYCLLFDALQRHRGRLKEVQLELQVSRKTLYDKLKKHQLDKSKFKAQ
ncbi:sigma-54-dependent Fis family transcriptional regulator [Vibrio parahaemolyticus]|uniref:sigma-54-dependent transcriptional regulator n=1 Tax=Vibrio parahaemolyticus TaxID=670 RepID=UPI000A36043F|nr:response regulator [Vibrio parahaemolyticus]EHH1103540.1 sigma-54-dependent Fis family transcriptional regulator [Vibrio parahaemolyticus]EHH1106854.1 sigma-54-dependent Fis family transcriptional regulator [Vibrio parahaemolyticus]EHH1931683.1 sigma-54-dependent Fis family transcriptional regulator [Vibrio parahaemolyticus]EHH1935616.1 sigma-54-dependent Fis family transcriptional regulator [Vibrio parahaemolyticus]EIE1196756.1 sigma-54-dependent Fis family transcriptional regulator [Vibri